jgi:hypothetical protein
MSKRRDDRIRLPFTMPGHPDHVVVDGSLEFASPAFREAARAAGKTLVVYLDQLSPVRTEHRE